jgi:elongation factor P
MDTFFKATDTGIKISFRRKKMPRVCDLKKGNVVEINDEAYMVKHIDVKSPSARGAVTLYKIRFNNIKTRQKYEDSYKGNDMLNEVAFLRRPVQYLYPDGPLHVFMDSQEYSQYMIEGEAIEDELVWITDGMEGIVALIIDENMVSIEIPKTLVFEISETAPGIKGASASARTKPATLSNGVEIQIPEYLEAGERVKVNTETKKFMSKA